MNSIGNIAKGIFIGDGALAAFKEISRNKGIKSGLFDKTTDSSVRKHNTNNNFPRTASYYYTLQKLGKTPMEFKRFFFGNLVSGDNIDGLDIGWAYTTDVNQTRIHGGSYVSSADFEEFQRLLRNNALTRGTVGAKGQNIYIATRYADYTLSNIDYEKSEIGNLYSTNEIDKQAYRNTHKVLQTQADRYITEVTSFKNKFGIHRYSTAKPYGITTKNNTPVYYKISEDLKDNKLKEDFIIDTNEFGEHDALPYSKKETDNAISTSTDSVGLLKYTENLFRNCKINSLVNRFHTKENQTGKKLSRGRNLTSKGTTVEGYDNPYCRVWTAVHQYSKMKDVIRPFYDDSGVVSLTKVQKKLSTSMRPNNGAEKLGNNSVLQNNGFVRITPTNESLNGHEKPIQNYMFSIENLAWRDKNKILTKEQLGPNKGRIMWFPPYNLKFSENINVNWNGNSFIGRGEQIYTYTNTERSGTLDFTLLIDHPSILNEWRGAGDGNNKSEEELLRFFAGCGMLNKDASIKEIDLTQEEEKPKPEPIFKFDTELIDGAQRVAYIIFYPNAYPRDTKMVKDADTKLNMLEILKDLCQYETSNDGSECIFTRRGIKNKNLYKLNDKTNDLIDEIKATIGDNPEDLDVKYLIDDIITEKITENSKTVSYNTGATEGNKLFGRDLTTWEVKQVEYHSTATNIGNAKINKELQTNRLALIKELLTKIGVSDNLKNANIINKPPTIVNVNDNDKINSKAAKYGRIGLVIISLVPKKDTKTKSEPVSTDSSVVHGKPLSTTKEPSTSDKAKVEESITQVVTDAVSRVENEFLYFTEISKDEKFVQPLLSRVRHFDPAFHSLTPEGFNARLTFLQQCTRQGPTAEFGSNNSQGAKSNLMTTASNLSFGRAPYCILRIGDFFNTKICIDSISINYDNGGGPQWDLNPEGAGVQPMFANVSINFKFLGGQDIAGPVEKLQNAITSNYYANASVYDVNAENGENKK